MASRTERGAPKSSKSSKAFVPLKDIFDTQIPRNSLVDVAGIAVDFQVPRPTQRDDWKCTIRLLDKSTESALEEAIGVHLFREESCMPKVQLGDIVVVLQAKVQCREFEAPSLLSSFSTVVRVYTASQIPRPPANALKALGSISVKGNYQGEKQPSKSEAEFVSSLFHSMDKSSLPSEAEYEVQTMTSAHVREKFCTLDKVEDSHFYNLIVEIVHCHDAGNQITLWVTDYTENQAFYNHSIVGEGISEVQEGDPYGYNAKFTKKSDKKTEWGGPFGKRCMQLTCWDEHAAAVHDETIIPGTWVLMKNVCVKYGKNGANLEGFLRGERGSLEWNSRVNISRLDPAEDPDTIDPRLKDAIRRKRDYERSKKKELKEVEEAAKAGQKRKLAALSDTTSSKTKSRKRRNKRKAAEKAGKITKDDDPAEAEETEDAADQSRQISPETNPTVTLNPHVKCEHHTIQPSGVSEILDHVYEKVDVDGEQVRVPLPFVNLNYRADVRISNFKPPDLRDFTFPKKRTEFDVLSDNEDSGSSSESEVDIDSTDNYDWQWRFFLELEDAKSGVRGEKFWVVVDNQSAQCLLSLDATNLREDADSLEELRQRMFVLWGNLEEVKRAQQAAAKRAKRSADIERPPLDSSDDEASTEERIANRAFPCCIRQYGVKVTEKDPDQANAGEGYRWERVYGMFGTRILTSV